MSRLLLVLALLLCACRSPLRLPESSALFPYGVASGEPRETGIRLWTRYVGEQSLRYELYRADEETEPVASGPVAVAEHGIAQVEVDGLSPGTAYRYLFVEAGLTPERSRLGRFRTPPAADAQPVLRFALFSCARNGASMHLMERAAASEVEASLFLGDTVYADSATTREAYREEWGENLGTLGFRLVRGSAPVIHTWDDHEIVNNWAGPSVPEARQRAAKEVFFESSPIAPHPSDPLRLWRSFRYGRTAEVFVLDARGERDPKSREGDDAVYLSEAQLSWLLDGLAASPATFKLVMNSVPITDMPGFFDAAADDRWEGYSAQRTRLLSELDARGIQGVVFLSGDFHLGAAGRVAPSGLGANRLEFIVGPASNFTNPLAGSLTPPQFDWAKDVNNFALLELDPVKGELEITYRDENGQLLFRKRYTP